MTSIATKISEINQRIADAALRSGRSVAAARLMAVSKTQPAEAVAEALAAGHRLFGENRVQEAAGKFPALKATYPDIELHLIGPLQTNKVAQAVSLFDVIQTVDRSKLAEALAKEMAKQGRYPRLLVEVNIGSEPQKAGILPEETAAFVARCRSEWGLRIEGLMAIPPADKPPGPYFKRMRWLAHEAGVTMLSMGMSADFETAIEEGATLVRVGTALFGARKKP